MTEKYPSFSAIQGNYGIKYLSRWTRTKNCARLTKWLVQRQKTFCCCDISSYSPIPHLQIMTSRIFWYFRATRKRHTEKKSLRLTNQLKFNRIQGQISPSRSSKWGSNGVLSYLKELRFAFHTTLSASNQQSFLLKNRTPLKWKKFNFLLATQRRK